MFKNKAFQIKIVPDAEGPITDAEFCALTADSISDAAIETTAFAAKASIAVMGAYFAMDTLRKIVVHTAITKIK